MVTAAFFAIFRPLETNRSDADHLSIAQKYIQQRFMNMDTAIVFNISELA
jgi:hypothetical protein